MRVLVMGGTGGFGSTICRLLAEDGHQVVAASRTAGADVPTGVTHVVLDRSTVVPADLRGYDVVVDASGPFQTQDHAFARSAIAAGAHHLDIADDRSFVVGISALDAQARAAGVAVLSGASSIPSLSSAVAVELATGLDSVDRIDMSISASAAAVFGRSVLGAMLAGAGRAITGVRGRVHAMTSPRRIVVASPNGPLRRTVLACDSPDVDVLPRLLPGRPQVRFRAGSELALHNIAMRAIAAAVRLRLVKSGTTFAHIAGVARRLTAGFGSGRSGMQVELLGRSGTRHVRRTWNLVAENGVGPTIPALVVPVIVRMLEKGMIEPGARPAAAMASSHRILSRLPRSDHDVTVIEEEIQPVYRRVLGPAWRDLPEAVRAMHDVTAHGSAVGTARVVRGRGPLAALVCAVMGFPPSGDAVPVRVDFDVEDGTETWTRRFGGSTFSSRLRRRGELLEERFGPLRFLFRLKADATGLRMHPRGWTLLGIPLPRLLCPDGVAAESEEAGAFVFDVPIRMPLVGLVVHYRGRLEPHP